MRVRVRVRVYCMASIARARARTGGGGSNTSTHACGVYPDCADLCCRHLDLPAARHAQVYDVDCEWSNAYLRTGMSPEQSLL